GATREDELAQHLILDQRQKFIETLVLVVVAIDIDDQDVIEVAGHGLLASVGEQPARIELFKGDAAAAVGKQVHGISWRIFMVGNEPSRGWFDKCISPHPPSAISFSIRLSWSTGVLAILSIRRLISSPLIGEISMPIFSASAIYAGS